MPPARSTNQNYAFRTLPSVDEVLRTAIGREIAASSGPAHAASMARNAIDTIRGEMCEAGAETPTDTTRESTLEIVAGRLGIAWQAEQKSGTRRVINATGVVIHTNLGRAPLSDNARRAIADDAAGYCTLEYDLDTGKRGKRGGRAETLLADLTGAESVLIVNNCAAAAFFVLTVFAGGGEVVISRGELVEIGGDFRVPDVLSQSGAKLSEVGTTNRTKLADYEKAIGEETRVILRVHPSNYRIIGFTASPGLAELAELAHRRGLLLYEDIGSGALIDLSKVGLADEPVVAGSIAAGVDIVTFSGDKLLGGPQAGIIAGKSEYIERLRKHPLYRALRVDKLAYAALEATLAAYRRESVLGEIPTLRMLSLTKAQIGERVRRLIEGLEQRMGAGSDLCFEMIDGCSAVGGGAAPEARLETVLMAVSHKSRNISRLEHGLRTFDPPVIARIAADRLVIDLRTVQESDEAALADAIADLN